MTSLKRVYLLTAWFCLAPGPVFPTPFDGIFRPVGEEYSNWSCKKTELGMDTGAVGIVDGYLEGVENRCALTEPRFLDGDRVEYTATCLSEGESYNENVVISRTETGIRVSRNGYTTEWQSCEAVQVDTKESLSNEWISHFHMGVFEASTRDADGNWIGFSCEDGLNGGLFVDLAGGPVKGNSIEFTVDTQAFSMTMMPDGTSVRTDCNVCAENYKALWRAVAAGRRLTVNTSDGRSVVFGLNGSRKALTFDICEPDRG